MSEQTDIVRPDKDIVLDRPHRGNIRCRVLRILRKGSLFGNVVADEVWVSGRFDGVAYAGKFMAGDGSKVFGAVNTDIIGIKPGASVQAHLGRAFPVDGFGRVWKTREEAILRAVEQEVAKSVEENPVQAPAHAVHETVPLHEAAEDVPANAPAKSAEPAAATPSVPSSLTVAGLEGLDRAIEEALRPLSSASLAQAYATVRSVRRAALPSLV